MKEMYDLIVIGGGTAGCAAAYTAGKLGLNTLIIEKGGCLGGSMTAGLVVPAMKSSENQINTVFFSDLIFEMKKFNSQISYQNNPGWFNPEILKIALDTMMLNAGVDVLFDTSILSVNHTEKHIKSIVIPKEILSPYNYPIQDDNKLLSVNIGARYVVDSTGNCEFGKILNCKFLDEEKNLQPFSLRFIMSGIDLSEFSEWIMDYDTDREVTTSEVIDGCLHLSTAYTWDNSRKWALDSLFKDAVKRGVLKPSDTNYFQVFTVPGMPSSLAFNCPRLVDETANLDVQCISNSLIAGRAAIYRLSEFCKSYFPGFKNAYISNISDMLGIRASRRIRGKYVYTLQDIIEGKKFKNPVAISNYPVDVHSKDKDGSTLRKVQEYQIPIESLMSEDYENLFIAGRCISCDSMAQGAIRVQPTCFSMGEGVAKYISGLISL